MQDGSKSKDGDAAEIELPADNKTPVIVYDVTGGLRMRDPEGFKPEPMLQIFADGRVVAGRNSSAVAKSQWKMPAGQLQQLLKRIVADRKFFEASTEQIAEQIKATGKKSFLMDAGTSKITVNLPNLPYGSQSVSVYAISFAPKTYAEVGALTRLAETVAELKGLRQRAGLGSDEQAAAVLGEINEAFAEEFPGVGAFELAGLGSAYRRADGSLTVSLAGVFESDEGAKKFRVSFKRASDGAEPEIRFFGSGR